MQEMNWTRLGLAAGLIAAALLVGLAPIAAGETVTYTFDDLTTGQQLDGQDHWTQRAVGANGGPSLNLTATAGADGTTALITGGGGGNTNSEASRLNDDAFSLPTFTGTETGAWFEADYASGYWGHGFGLGYDRDGDGVVGRNETREIGLWLALAYAGGEIRLYDAAGTQHAGDLSSITFDSGYWSRLRVVMDFTANGGQGSASVYGLSLTAGETDYVAIAGLQDIGLGLDQSANSAYNPTLWNAMYIDFESSPGGLDNLSVSNGTDPVPEPATLSLLGLGLAGMAARRLRRKNH